MGWTCRLPHPIAIDPTETLQGTRPSVFRNHSFTRNYANLTVSTVWRGTMRRREFIALIGSAFIPLFAPSAAMAQRSGGPRVVGYIAPGPATTKPLFAELLAQRLSELGWVEGRDVVLEYRYADGSIDRVREAAAEFERMKDRCHLSRW